MALRLLRGGHEVVIHDPSAEAMQPVAAEGGVAIASLAAMIGKLAAPRTVWVMVPAGAITEQVVNGLSNLLSPGDTLRNAPTM